MFTNEQRSSGWFYFYLSGISPCSAVALEVNLLSKLENLREDTSFRVLRHLSENPSSTQRDLAREFGVSLGMVNFCVHALIDKGCLKIEKFQESKSKSKYIYNLTPKGMAEKASLTKRFLERKAREYRDLKAEIEKIENDRDVQRLKLFSNFENHQPTL